MTEQLPAASQKKEAPFSQRINGEALAAILPELTEAERERISAVIQKAEDLAAGPNMKLSLDSDGVLTIALAHRTPEAAAALAMADVGTCDPAFFEGLGGQIACIGSAGQSIDQTASNFLLSVVRAVKPKDELEAMQAVQMGAIHQATMMMVRRFNRAETVPQQDAAERAFNKLARTYAMQMEALKRYRTGGQQKVVVEHVTVNEGGKAIVGNVEHGGRG